MKIFHFTYRIAIRPVILLAMFCTATGLQAQDRDRQSIDSIRMVIDSIAALPDTVTTDVIDPPPQEMTDTAKETEVNYFLKNEFAMDSATLYPYSKRTISLKNRGRLKDDKAFWYANAKFGKKKIADDNDGRHSFLYSDTFQTMLWILIVITFAAVLILYLHNSNAGLFRRSRSIGADEEIVETDDIFAINYPREIEKAVNASNYRFAVRLMFLRMLRELSERNLISYTQEKTNYDYLRQMRDDRLYDDFFRLTRNYEYSWYGQFALNAEKFAIIRKDFESLGRKFR